MAKECLVLNEMIQELSSGPEIYKPSYFWKYLGDLNHEQLQRRGYCDFKRTVNQNYYNWVPREWNDNQLIKLRHFWLKNKSLWPIFLHFKKTNDFEIFTEKQFMSSWKNRWRYKLFIGMLWEYARSQDPDKLLDKLEEPLLGKPLVIKRGKQRISQDLANSMLERNIIMKRFCSQGDKTTTVAELGAGYGRLAYIFLKTTPFRYFIIDIPPALDLSQWYLSKLFPERRIFRFRHFDNFTDVSDELNQCDIAFFTPNQLEMFPDNYVNIFTTISSLHEMRMDQIQNYITIMGRITKNLLFLKQWYVTFNAADNITVRREDYLLPEDWNTVEVQQDPIQDLFFTLLAEKK